MDEAELNAIREARLAELQKNSGQQSARSDEKISVLSQVLEPSARERLSRVRIVRPDRADAVEQYLVKMISMGSIRRKLGEQDIVEILDSLSRDEKKASSSQIVFDRKHLDDDDDDDFFD
ncbi:uncharacterized protein CXQ87_001645 [Candidozyma duobushaemuli]|uniref:Programmed cell death protein 5 n=2 Tax=Candidozyma TaxID=3303203 RepID=A0ABX8I8K7_9ASCO|nr:uncharacterized protein CXQ87_001645 [[Candida] duobushaemulonis]PVH13539.1 hypothetical protein CXQ87_001645 [[Candida] duobushaemulonis]QWU88218.1 hypothetical protein CA3LBN_002483 [[Candida] haemuloni]